MLHHSVLYNYGSGNSLMESRVANRRIMVPLTPEIESFLSSPAFGGVSMADAIRALVVTSTQFKVWSRDEHRVTRAAKPTKPVAPPEPEIDPRDFNLCPHDNHPSKCSWCNGRQPTEDELDRAFRVNP